MVLADRIVDDIDAFVRGESFGLGFEILLGIEDDFVGSGVFGERGFFGVETVPMTRAPSLGKLRDQESSPPAAAWTMAVSPDLRGNVDRVR